MVDLLELLNYYREEVVPIFIQETVVEKDRFRICHACAVITEQESRRDLAADGTLG